MSVLTLFYNDFFYETRNNYTQRYTLPRDCNRPIWTTLAQTDNDAPTKSWLAGTHAQSQVNLYHSKTPV